MRTDRSTADVAGVPDDWAVSTIVGGIDAGARVAVVGLGAADLVDAISEKADVVAVVSPAVPLEKALFVDVDVIVLAESVAYVSDEIAHLRDVSSLLAGRVRLILSVRNITWLPNRVLSLQGRSPFGSGPVVDRPLRFFSRTSILDAMLAAGIPPVGLDVVRLDVVPQTPGAGHVVIDAAAAAPDSGSVGFVVSAGAPASDDREPDDGEPGCPTWEDLRRSVRLAVREADASAADAEAERVVLTNRITALESEVERLSGQAVAAQEELAIVTGRLAHRLLVRIDGLIHRVPGGEKGARLAGRAVRAIRRDDAAS